MKRFISFFLLAFVANIITWLFIYFKIKPNSEIVPLHYNVFYGADLVGKGYYLYLLPVAGLVIIVINFVFSRYAQRLDRFAGRTLAAVSLVCQIIIFIAVVFLKTLILV